MILAIDIGNSSVSFGVFRGDDIVMSGRFASDKSLKADDYAIILKRILDDAKINGTAEISAVCACSVVPPLDAVIDGAVSIVLKRPVLFAGRDLPFGMPVDYEFPGELGSDRVVNAVGAYQRFKGPVIIVDAGTAITVDYVTPEGRFAGGAIAPGFKTASDALHKNTARLPYVEIKKPERSIGRSTVEGIRAGIYWGMVGLVDRIIEEVSAAAGSAPAIISTGGDGGMLAEHSKYIKEYDEFLTLKGLKIISQSGE